MVTATAKPQVLILKGLPASGKTTYAKELMASDLSWYRVNKDELRLLYPPPDGQWTPAHERDVIVPERNRRIMRALWDGKNVIVDDTNLAHKHEKAIREMVRRRGAEVTVKTFDVPLEECIRRDSLREGSSHVGEEVIRRMANETPLGPQIMSYSHQDGLPWAVLCDIDGTVALCDGIRNPHDESKVHLDAINLPIRHLLWAIEDGLGETMIYVSGRHETCREKTIDWLRESDMPYDGLLYMRGARDNRRDDVVKQELFDQHVRGKFNIRFVLDDRDRVVKFWRAIGLTCLQVAAGDF